jgi:hypothetical protein
LIWNSNPIFETRPSVGAAKKTPDSAVTVHGLV